MKQFIGLLILMSFCASPAFALSLGNGGFETGNFTNWQSLGLANVQTAGFGSGPQGGNYQAFLDTGDGTSLGTATTDAIETFLGIPNGFVTSINPVPAFFQPMDGSSLKQTFSAFAGEVLSFQWNFLTNDGLWGGGADPDASRDSSFLTLIGPGLLFGSTLSDTLDYPNQLGSQNFATNPFLTSSTSFNMETGFRNISIVLPNNGDYTVGFGVVNSGLDGASSGLLVDQVSTSLQSTPEPSAILLFGSGLIGLASWRWNKRRRT